MKYFYLTLLLFLVFGCIFNVKIDKLELEDIDPEKINIVSLPEFSIMGGAYPDSQTLIISTITPDASIHYTLDNSTPTCVSQTYSSQIVISESVIIKAIACKSGWSSSEVKRASYTITGTLPQPIFDPSPGTYASAQSVTISCSSSGASIHYTTSGSNPTCSSSIYSGAISISSTRTVKAIACKSGWTSSPIKSGTYTITGTLSQPTFNPSPGTYTSAQSVTISCSSSGASIHYTTSGSNPTCSSSIYSGAISISSTGTVKAIACKSGWAPSSIGGGTYTITGTLPQPTFNPSPGTYTSAQSVTISCSSSGASIHYTTSGLNPTCSSSIYSGAISISSTCTVKAIACQSGWTSSPIGSGTYTITETVPGYSLSLPQTPTGLMPWDNEAIVFKNKLYFWSMEDAAKLYNYDNLTDKVTEIPGILGQRPKNLTISQDGNYLAFTSYTNDPHKYHVYVYNDDGAQAQQVPLPISSGSGYRLFIWCNNKLVLYADEIISIFDPYTSSVQTEEFPGIDFCDYEPAVVSDGKMFIKLNDNTLFIYDESTGVNSSIIIPFTIKNVISVGDTLFLTRDEWIVEEEDYAEMLYEFDFASKKALKIPGDLHNGFYQHIILNGRIFFGSRQKAGIAHYETKLYFYDGSQIVKVSDINPFYSAPQNFLNINNKLYFDASTKVTGTVTDTVKRFFVYNPDTSSLTMLDICDGVEPDCTYGTEGIVVINNKLFFHALDDNSDYQLYAYEPGSNTTSKLTDGLYDPLMNINDIVFGTFHVSNNKLMFFAEERGANTISESLWEYSD